MANLTQQSSCCAPGWAATALARRLFTPPAGPGQQMELAGAGPAHGAVKLQILTHGGRRLFQPFCIIMSAETLNRKGRADVPPVVVTGFLAAAQEQF
eukprot:1000976-Pelagomonas_calceolata.AAC.6